MKHYPAIDIRFSDSDSLYAALDDCAPTALEERDAPSPTLRAFFLTAAARDAAVALLAESFDVTAVEVPDDDWARRSQENLQPVTVGRVTILPSGAAGDEGDRVTITIPPSMGFGTGHHATTRLCLAALQRTELAGRRVLDVGTGSGVLAIAAAKLGAAEAVGIDFDPDAIQSAEENLSLNRSASGVSFAVADLANAPLPHADVVTANLTGALLIRSAALLMEATKPGGTLILSGLMVHERDEVCEAFAAASIEWERAEDEWVGLAMKKS